MRQGLKYFNVRATLNIYSKEKNNVLFARYVKYKLHHETDHTFHTPTQPLK